MCVYVCVSVRVCICVYNYHKYLTVKVFLISKFFTVPYSQRPKAILKYFYKL